MRVDVNGHAGDYGIFVVVGGFSSHGGGHRGPRVNILCVDCISDFVPIICKRSKAQKVFGRHKAEPSKIKGFQKCAPKKNKGFQKCAPKKNNGFQKYALKKNKGFQKYAPNQIRSTQKSMAWNAAVKNTRKKLRLPFFKACVKGTVTKGWCFREMEMGMNESLEK